MIAQAVGITSRNVQVNIQSLKALGLVKRVGAAKSGHWVVNDFSPRSNQGSSNQEFCNKREE